MSVAHSLDEVRQAPVGLKQISIAEDLTDFPMEILRHAATLEVLDVSNNQLSSLPDELAMCVALRVVFASNNRFQTLPNVLGKCQTLQIVGFKANQIRHVESVALSESLRWLILTDNRIEALPEDIGKLRMLEKCMLAGNALQGLPDSLRDCQSLRLLRISANKLLAFPDVLLSLSSLAWLAFAGNPFCCDPATDSLGQERSLHEVDMASLDVHEVLGQGASGVISRAYWPEHKVDTPFAIKVFKGSVTSDGYPEDELQACLHIAPHAHLIDTVARVTNHSQKAVLMRYIPAEYRNLGLPPSLDSCTRDIFAEDTRLHRSAVTSIVLAMLDAVSHIHAHGFIHGDIYAHNILLNILPNKDAEIVFGDFGASSYLGGLTAEIQAFLLRNEMRALGFLMDDVLSLLMDEKSERHDQLVYKLRRIRDDFLTGDVPSTSIDAAMASLQDFR